MRFERALASWGTSNFNEALKSEILQLDKTCLPLQQALKLSSYVSNSDIGVSILSAVDNGTTISANIGVFFTGIIAGSCCSDDPTPVDELQEYCELKLTINQDNAETTIQLLDS